MDSKTIVTVTRMVCGAAIFITSMVMGVNGAYQMLAMFLMAVPVEVLQPVKKEEK